MTFSREQDKEKKNFSLKDDELKNSGITTRKTIVINELGMHARPAGKIALMAEQAHSDIWLSANDSRVDATSLIDILTLGAVKGTQVMVEIENSADVNILNRIVEFFENGFGEN